MGIWNDDIIDAIPYNYSILGARRLLANVYREKHTVNKILEYKQVMCNRSECCSVCSRALRIGKSERNESRIQWNRIMKNT